GAVAGVFDGDLYRADLHGSNRVPFQSANQFPAENFDRFLTNMSKPRILSGMRPTGRLHLGHLVGALENWVKLQDQYECFHCIVDWHALTTNYEATDDIRANILDNAMDWLAAGLDPARATIYVQSRVVEHAELHLLLSMLTPLGWLERV